MKKLLALVLALVMTMSLVTISNAAFSDADKIDHKEAVEVMNALGVINGMPDGSFAPAGNVTRAEMAKMITIIMLGDIDAAAFKGTTTDLTDINGHWAEGYIKYCYSQGVIAGRGDGTFAPNANVTAVEAAKMLLVAIGYNATVQGYVGSQWSINIIRDAQLSKFFDKLSVTSNKVLTRDEAAQMIWNAVQATMIEKTSSVGRNDGSIRDSYAPYGKRADGSTVNLLSETFGAKKQYGYLGTATYNDDNKNLYTYTIGRDPAFGAGEIKPEDDGITVTTLKTANDYTALFGQRVAVVYKDSKTVYGIYSDAKVLATATVGAIKDEDGNALNDATDSTIKMGDVKVKLATTVAAAKIYEANNSTALKDSSNVDYDLYTLTGVSKYSKIAAIDNNDDGKADVFVVYPVTAQKVTYVGTASITAGGQVYNYDKETGLYKNSSINYTFPKDIAKDDYVLVPAYGVSGVTRELTKVEKVSGKVNATKSSSAKIADVWYDKNGNSVTLGDTYDVWTVEGYMAAVKVVSSASKDVALLIADENATTLNKSQAKLMFADGKVEIVSVSKYDGDALEKDEKASTKAGVADGEVFLVTYKVLDDSTYDVKKVDDSNKAGYDVYSGTGTSYTEASSSSGTPAKLNGSIIADDAVIMIVSKANSDPKYSVIDGKTLKTYSSFTTDKAVQALYASNNGVDTVKVATVISNSDFFGVTAAYGYVVSAPYMTKEGNTQYNNYDVWTVDGLVTIKDNNYNGVNHVTDKGQVVSLQKNNNDTYTGTVEPAVTVAVSGYSSTDNIITLTKTDGSVYGTANMSLKDAKVLFADTKNKTGIEGGEIAVAEKTNDGGFKANALAVYADSKLKLLIADTSNLLNGTTTECGYTMTLTGIPTGATVTNGDGSTVESGAKLATGSTVVITFKHNAAATLNVTGATATWTNLDDNSTGNVHPSESFGANINWKVVVTVGSSNFGIAFT